MTIVMVIFQNLTQLDLTGPYEVFARLPDTRIFLTAENEDPVASDSGLRLIPDATFQNAPQADILFVPGGKGTFEAMQNKKLIDFLKKQGSGAKYITSVCTGSLILASAGLLSGYKATTHWLSLGLLKLFDVDVVEARVVIDRNRITAGGVTAGIDFGLRAAAWLFNDEVAKEVQLLMEYNPDPPFTGGSHRTAEKDIVERMVASREEIQRQRAELIKKITSA